MTKYIAIFSYSSGSWARMINSPGDRTAAARQLLESFGGSLECLTGSSGRTMDTQSATFPTQVTAEAVAAEMSRSGSFKSVEAHELLTQQQLIETLELAEETPGRSTRHLASQPEVLGVRVRAWRAGPLRSACPGQRRHRSGRRS